MSLFIENKKKIDDKAETEQLFNFFEELCWLLDSNNNLNFKIASNVLKKYRNEIVHGTNTSGYKLNNVTYNLIGILPSLLKDVELFQNNFQLVQFADEVLLLHISRWEKRSRNEIIGLIICEVEEENKKRMDTLTKWVACIIQNKKRVKVMQRDAEQEGHLFSWNDTLQRLFGENDE